MVQTLGGVTVESTPLRSPNRSPFCSLTVFPAPGHSCPFRIIAYGAHAARPILEPKDVDIAIGGWVWVSNSHYGESS